MITRRASGDFVGLLLILTTVLTAPLLSLAAMPPRGGPVLVIVAPWDNPDTVVSLAGGRPVLPVPALMATLATGDDGFGRRAVQQGAWIVADGGWLAAICGAGS
ncbi:hypothetical protein [Jannaschia aquimarina]|uniref:Uncharacterized protein n=1 Tax=Jannaschia aquimarina TaxID=935700 RepID=A0A0D1EAZ8_9RHOB|nr:hypothetical protein [Jannaschia aquimarina]KIT14914.1 hypothetical protein jaqu_32390 [Jannaschia aquimarina]SNS59195.1 hypothetical protein SAMN05421775_101564 [Jannaschia aquimarina]